MDEKTDIYSLGIVLWELYTQTRTEMERVEGISSLRQGKAEVRQPMEEVQAGLGELVRLLTSNNPEDRPTAASMLEQQFSEKDLFLLDSGREAKALRDQVFSSLFLRMLSIQFSGCSAGEADFCSGELNL